MFLEQSLSPTSQMFSQQKNCSGPAFSGLLIDKVVRGTTTSSLTILLFLCLPFDRLNSKLFMLLCFQRKEKDSAQRERFYPALKEEVGGGRG